MSDQDTDAAPRLRLGTPTEMARDDHGHGCFAIDLDDQVQSFDDTIRDALISRGVLYQDAETVWRLCWHGFDLDRERAAWMAVCDFCNERPVTWNFPCRSFAMPDMAIVDEQSGAGTVTPPMTSRDDWAACEPCGELVTAGNRRGLLRRILDRESKWTEQVPREMRAHFRAARVKAVTILHEQFWRHRTGEATALPPHPFGH